MEREELIEKKKSEPITVGSDVIFKEEFLNSKSLKRNYFGKVVENIDKEYCAVKYYDRLPCNENNLGNNTYKIEKANLEHNSFYVGHNPFKEFRVNITVLNYNLESVIGTLETNTDFKFVEDTNGVKNIQVGDFIDMPSRIEELKSKGVKFTTVTSNGIDFDPTIISQEGKEFFYQRGLLWSEEHKQLLIESIYNRISIGTFVVKRNSYDFMLKQAREKGKCFNYQCVDGKQRLNAIADFIDNKFPDMYGKYYKDLSGVAKSMFQNYSNFSYMRMDENSTDQDIQDMFLTHNFTGVPMSAEHLNYVKSIRL